MNNLESLKSELLYEYSEEEFNLWRSQNFYQHHNLPARTLIKTSEGTNQHRKTLLHFTPKQTATKPTPLVPQPIGRNIFLNPSKAEIPGPGSYDVPLRRHSSHCYIKKEQNFIENKIAKRLRKRKLINECRGPGIYNPQTAFRLTSKNKVPTQGTFSRSPLQRLIIPEKKIENLYLLSSSREQYPKSLPHKPTSRQHSSSTTLFPKAISYKISSTQRSSIINENGLPGPGFYNWDKYFQRKLKDESKEKGKIQFKFVYGHPS